MPDNSLKGFNVAEGFANGINVFDLKALNDPSKNVETDAAFTAGWGSLSFEELEKAGYSDLDGDKKISAFEVKLEQKLKELGNKPLSTNELGALLGLPPGVKLTADQLKLLGVTDQAAIDNYLKEPSTPINFTPDQIKNIAQFGPLLSAKSGPAKLAAIDDWCKAHPGLPITPQMALALGLSPDQVKGIAFMRDGHPDPNVVDYTGLKSLLLGNDPLHPFDPHTPLPILNNFPFHFLPDGDTSNPTGKLATKAEVVAYLKTMGMTDAEANSTADYLDRQDLGPNNGVQGDGLIQVNRLMATQNVLASAIQGPAGVDGDPSNPTHRLLTRDSVVALLVQSGLPPDVAAAEADRLDNADMGKGDKTIQANRVIDLLNARNGTPQQKIAFLQNWVAQNKGPITTSMAVALGLTPEQAKSILFKSADGTPMPGIVDFGKLQALLLGNSGDSLSNVTYLGGHKPLATLPDIDKSNPTGKLVKRDDVVEYLRTALGLTQAEAEKIADTLDCQDKGPNKDGKGDGLIQLNRLMITQSVLSMPTAADGDPTNWTGKLLTRDDVVALFMRSGMSETEAKLKADDLDRADQGAKIGTGGDGRIQANRVIEELGKQQQNRTEFSLSPLLGNLKDLINPIALLTAFLGQP